MFEEAIKTINQSENILILPHVNPDGDALGSCYALSLILRALGKKTYVSGDCGHAYCSYLYGADSNIPSDSYDLAIAVDCADEDRLGDRLGSFSGCERRIVIDHHATNTLFGQQNFVDADASATAELIYKLASELGVELDACIASDLYLALSADTGCFQYSNVTPRTMRIGADLIEKGAEHAKINELLFSSNTIEKLTLMSMALNSLKTFLGGRIACVSLTQDEIISSGARPEECDGIVTLPRSLDTADIAIFIRENSDSSVKVSMRSNDKADVAEICALNGGGGHKKAAGCTLNCSIDEAIEIITGQCERCLKG